MEFEIYTKKENKYELRVIEMPTREGRRFLDNLLVNTKLELDKIRNDIVRLSNSEKEISLTKPTHPDKIIQEKLDKLIEIRRINLDLQQKIQDLLRDNEFIICDRCGSKMYKKPCNVQFEKIGNSYNIKSHSNDLEYIYSCSNDNCHYFIQEHLYERQQQLLKLREELINQGYNYLPDEFGYWHKLDDGKPMNKPPMFSNDDNKSWDRVYENIKVGNQTFMKIKEICQETGEVKYIK